MTRGRSHFLIWTLALVALLTPTGLRAQEPFDFEAFAEHVEAAQAFYQAARALSDDEAERRRELYIDSAEAQQQAIDMLRRALRSDVFAGSDREEASERLLELSAGAIVLWVEAGECGSAASALDEALAEPRLLPERGGSELLELRASVEGCVPYVAEAEEPSPETTEPEPLEPDTEPPPELAETGEAAGAEVVIEEGGGRARPLRTAAWISGSVAVACLGTALAFYLNTRSLQDDLDAEVARPRFDPDEAESIWSDIERSDDLMNVFLWSGVALAAGTAILVTLAVTSDGEETIVAPAAIPGGAGLGVIGRF